MIVNYKINVVLYTLNSLDLYLDRIEIISNDNIKHLPIPRVSIR